MAGRGCPRCHVLAGAALLAPSLPLLPFLLLAAIFLAGCAPYQATLNANQLVSNVDTIREAQIIYNIQRAINDPSMVPSQVVISTGQAQATTGVNSTFSIGVHFVKSFSALVPDSWTSTWTLTPVSDGGDLQNLRGLYQFIVTDHPIALSQATRSAKLEAAASLLQLSTQTLPSRTAPYVSAVPTATEAANMLIGGQSWLCQKYQSEKSETQLYNQWLFWFRDGGWHPSAPNPRYPLIPLDMTDFIYITSRSCFDDFIILVQSLSPLAHAAAANSSKAPTTIPTPAGSR